MTEDESPDELLREIWAIKDRISAAFDHDIGKLARYYQEYQKQFGDRLVPAPERTTKRERPAA